MHVQHAVEIDGGEAPTSGADIGLADPQLQLYGVADGAGCPNAAEVSALALEVARRDYRASVSRAIRPLSRVERLAALRRAAEQAASEVHAYARGDGPFPGASTTLTLLAFHDGQALVAHVGDSRLYLYRRGRLEQLTTDHTVAHELWRAGNIGPDEARRHPMRNVLSRSLGPHSSVLVETLTIAVRSGDRYILTTDGTAPVPEDVAAARTALANPDLDAVARGLGALVRRRKPQRVATVVVTCSEAQTSPRAIAVEAVDQVPLFAGLDLASRSRIVGAGNLIDLAPGDVLFEPSAPVEGLHVVASGQLRWIGSGPPVLLRTGAWWGEAALIRARPCPARIECDIGATIIWFRMEELRRLARRRPTLGCTLFIRLSSILGEDATLVPNPRPTGAPGRAVEPHVARAATRITTP